MADAPRGGVNEYAFSLGKPRQIAEPVERGEERDGYGGRLLVGESRRLANGERRMRDSVRGKGSLRDSEHFVARTQVPHSLAASRDDTGKVAAEQ